jgi:hypothetical protein
MAKTDTTDLSAFCVNEAKQQTNGLEYLKASALLIGDVESLYMQLSPLVTFPAGTLDSPDQLRLFVTLTCNQLMMSRMLYTKSVVSALRMYQADALTHLRRAIEGCAFAFRMSRDRSLCKVWAEAGKDDKSYSAYRDAFENKKVYRKKGHPDYHPLMLQLKDKFDIASKQLHGSVFGMANHFTQARQDSSLPNTRFISFIDMPPDSFPSVYFMILQTHLTILALFVEILQPHLRDFQTWKKEYDAIAERVMRHVTQWLPKIQAWNAARNQRKAKSTPNP